MGIQFRDDSRGTDFWANRNLIENNRILDSGEANGIAIDLLGNTKDVTIRANTIKESRAPMQRIGVRIDKAVKRLTIADNTIEGFAQDVVDARA